MKKENAERLGELSDELENVWTALQNEMIPPQIHVTGISGVLPEKIKAIREIVIAETGQNHWEDCIN